MKNKLMLTIIFFLYMILLILFLITKPSNVFNPKINSIDTYKQMEHFKINKEDSGIKHYAILSVVHQYNPDSYKFATDTVHCYAHAYNYTYIVISMQNEPELSKKCPQNDIMFSRHCYLAEYLEMHKEIDYALFIDADTAVINPYHSLSEFSPKGNEEFLLYSRLFNYEIACGSFFFKNSNYSRDLLKGFANFYYKLPNSMHGTDNAAIQAYFLQKFVKNSFLEERTVCYKLWNRAQNWDDIWDFEACTKYILEQASETPLSSDLLTFDNGKVVVVGKESKRRWIRDGPITKNLFCEKDFLLHGYKGTQSSIKSTSVSNFIFDPESCINKPLRFLWRFKKNKVISCTERDFMISDIARETREDFYRDLNDSGYLKKYKINKFFY
uniref:Nucleotide-diphospho-sugar transferase domain-containing protein n=2 Tax=Strongyloides stercoralis TaxID=6248 RepID=A0AAF5D2C3_STRER